MPDRSSTAITKLARVAAITGHGTHDAPRIAADMVLIALAFTSLASGGFFAGLLKPAPTAAARELRELLVDAVRARSAPDASRADELIEELAEAKVPFRAELLGASSSVCA